MSFEITTAFVQQYRDNVYGLAQQAESRLRDMVWVKDGVKGKSTFQDQFGVTSMQQKTVRHGDTPLISTPFSRRKVDIAPYQTADLIDNDDQVRTLIDPTSATAQAMAAAAGRQIDQLIIDAAFADASTGETGSTSVSFPAGNVIAVDNHEFDTGSGNVGLTVGKLIASKVAFDAAEVDSEDRFIACTSKQIGDLLTNTETTSSDYNTVKALVHGEMDTFLGFKFIQLEGINTDSNSYRRVIAAQKKGLCLAVGEDIRARISERGDKNYATQVYFELDMGAARLEESRVLEIKCAE